MVAVAGLRSSCSDFQILEKVALVAVAVSGSENSGSCGSGFQILVALPTSGFGVQKHQHFVAEKVYSLPTALFHAINVFCMSQYYLLHLNIFLR